jgi:methionyl aminopeptidase
MTHPARFQTKKHPSVKADEVSDEYKREKLFEAGKIASKIRNHIASKVIPGASVWELCYEADEMIRNEGAAIAFPINISINNAAAHYTANIDDELKIPKKGVVKVDVGVQIDGFIADTAQSVDLDGGYKSLVQATIDATNLAIKMIKPGTMTGDLGGVIEKVIKKYGYEPVKELSGHLVDRHIVHAGKTVPCVANPGGGDRVEEGEVYAIETFASTGQGSVHPDLNKITIFRASPIRVRPRGKAARMVHNVASKEFNGMPFAARMLLNHGLTKPQIMIGLRELQKIRGIVEYHVLNGVEKTDVISQYEHTMLITKDGAEVTTDQ